ncbi:hypothetical protein [Legionella worsleiensis]|uniref:Putative esterase with patatin domain protein n=1 Tax=Legionella worsleiensis TaxID=45076 RepID=A0A0W1A9W1_9GAMM|nr:hypothetical protein [Legionella worsleiensis]KTD77968.1 putative esterase with patatin domain protein [Legionella worsleiensis]STY31579.1 putative esterase with patatin domain [Legionella worsleiensis]
MEHSQMYRDMVKPYSCIYPRINESVTEQRLDIEAVIALIKNTPKEALQNRYRDLCDLLRETNDAQWGIVSGLLEEKGEPHWVRDATAALPLEQRIPPNAPIIEANNTLLRCLSRLRPVDYAINQKFGAQEPGNTCRECLKNRFTELTRAALETAQSDKTPAEKLNELLQLETNFNTCLIAELHQANLTQGCETAAQAEELLFHYRNLSSLLENPARIMVTLTYDAQAQVFQRETQYPVTEKTSKQHELIKELSQIQPYPLDEEKNAHNVKNIAAQQADSFFAGLMNEDTTALSAQARKTHPIGAKNAFLVKNELFNITAEDLKQFNPVSGAAEKDHTLWLVRMGVPVYVGKGESASAVAAYTVENLEQIRKAALQRMGIDHPRLHVTCLNTYSPLEHQTIMIDHLYKATRQKGKGDDITYAPTNPDGTFRALDIAPGLQFDPEDAPVSTFPLQKANRLEQVAKIVLAAANQDNTLSIVQCASGQDRTGTAVEKATQSWMQKQYSKMGKDSANIETMRAQGGNAAEITTHHIHGSPGMKTDSMAYNFFGRGTAFSRMASQQFYRSSAKTNKQNRVGAVGFLKHPSPEAWRQYYENVRAYEQSLADLAQSISGDTKKQQLYDSGMQLLAHVKKIAAKQPDAHALVDLNATLPHCTLVVTNHDRLSNPEFQDSIRRLASVSQHVSGSSSPLWKAFGVGLLTFTCLALVVAGVVAAIPSGGTSLLLTVVGAVAVTGATGLGAYATGSEKGLAKAVTEFKSSLHHIRQDEETNQHLSASEEQPTTH